MTDPTQSWEEFSGRGDPNERWRIYRLCECAACGGSGKDEKGRCPACRGEGRERELVATCASPEAVGVALVTLGREGEFEDCPVGILDTEGEVGHKWVLRPWAASPRQISDAARVLATAPRKKGGATV